jgi:hypothetical protein
LKNGLAVWPRTYFIFGDIEAMLDVLRVDTKCERKGRYHVRKLKWREMLNADCPKSGDSCTIAAT